MPKCDIEGCEETDTHKHHALRDVAPFNRRDPKTPGSRGLRERSDLVQRLCATHHQVKGHHLFSASNGWPPGLGFPSHPFLRGDPKVERTLERLLRRPVVPAGRGLRARRSPRPADRETAGGVANLALYQLCEAHPDHSDVGATEAKLSLIGKHYSASPKRGVGHAADGDETGFFERLARRLKISDLDARLDVVRAAGRVDQASVRTVADAHARMVDEVTSFIDDDWNGGRTSRRARGRTSFCSKYLHFHVPEAFFIYDSVIKRRLLMRGSMTYLAFCETMLAFAKDNADVDWTPRSIDMDIYGYGDPGPE